MVLLVKAGPAVDDFIKQLEAFFEKSDHRRQSIKQGAHSIQELASKLRKARQIVLLVKADVTTVFGLSTGVYYYRKSTTGLY